MTEVKTVRCKSSFIRKNLHMAKGELYQYRVSAMIPQFCIMTSDLRYITALTPKQMKKHMEPVPEIPPVYVVPSWSNYVSHAQVRGP